MVYRGGHDGRRETRHFSEEPSQRISPLEILQVLADVIARECCRPPSDPLLGPALCQMEPDRLSWVDGSWDSAHSRRRVPARFQQKQLQEKEEKLLKLFQDQQERALKSVGSRSHSGGSSVSSTSSVGVGKVRHMFQSRRENSEPRLGASITGRDKSHPLEPLTKNRYHFSTSKTPWDPTQHLRTLSLDRHNIRLTRDHNDNDLDLDENHNRERIGVRRTDSRPRRQKTKPRWEEDPEEVTHGQSFRLVDEYPGSRYQRVDNYNNTAVHSSKRQPYENVGVRRGRVREKLEKLASGGLEDLLNSNSMEGRYKSYVSQTAFAKKAHLGNGSLTTGRTGVTARQTTEVKESSSSGYLNGSVSSPVRKIRKPTPVPLSVAPPQHLLQKEMRKTTRIETIKEVPPSVASPKTTTTRTQSLTGTNYKSPTPGRTLPPSRVPPTKATSTPAGRSAAPPSDLVDCRICGRHFAADRVSKHEEVCQKSTRNKRKPFDALQQRVKGTEVEQYVKKSTKSRSQADKAAKPQSNWRKKHEEFINNIRAAKEVSAHLKKGGKLSDLPPPPPSDYSDYVPCPHCGRKFNASAAERHIPKCANIINNKPKPSLQKSGGLKQSSKLLHPASTSVRGRK